MTTQRSASDASFSTVERRGLLWETAFLDHRLQGDDRDIKFAPQVVHTVRNDRRRIDGVVERVVEVPAHDHKRIEQIVESIPLKRVVYRDQVGSRWVASASLPSTDCKVVPCA